MARARTYDACTHVHVAICQVIATIMDYQLQRLAKASHMAEGAADVERATAGYASFMGSFGLACNTVSLAFSLFGTSGVISTYGVRCALVTFPVVLSAASVIAVPPHDDAHIPVHSVCHQCTTDVAASCVLHLVRAASRLYLGCIPALQVIIMAQPSVWVLFWLMVAVKALSYALSSPAREMLYSVTSDAIKCAAELEHAPHMHAHPC